MKKTLIIVAIAAVIGGGGYFAMNKTKQAAAEFGDKQLNAQIELYKKQPYIIRQVQAHPLIERAEFKIISSDKDSIHSVIILDVIEKEAVEIPLLSKITRGEVKYQDKSYGYGKIVTTPDTDKLKELPAFIKPDTLSNTTYIGLDGDLFNVATVKPIKIPEENVDFKGASWTVDSNVATSSAYDTKFTFNGFSANNGIETINLENFYMVFEVGKDGKYIGHSSPMAFDITKFGNKTMFKLGKGDYQGIYKTVEGLNTPIGNGLAKFEGSSITDNQKTLKFTKVTFEGGYYETGKHLLDLKAQLSADIDANSDLLNTLPVKVTPKSVSLNYGFTNIAYDAVNTYLDAMHNLQMDSGDISFTDTQKKTMIQSMQKSGAGFFLNADLTTGEGNADADAKFTFSEAGKNADIDSVKAAFEQRTPEQALSLFDGKANLKVNKALAKATQTAMYLMMIQAKEEGDNYIINAEIKNGKVTVNGQPMM